MKKSETEKLNAYSDAISKLDPEDQMRKMNAVSSDASIVRFLSEDSPDQLVNRFAARLNGTVRDNLSRYEMGRVTFELRHDAVAQEYFEWALVEGDGRANYYLGEIHGRSGNALAAIEYLKKSVALDFRKEDALILLADLADLYNEKNAASSMFFTAREYCSDRNKTYCAVRAAQTMGAGVNPVQELKGLINKGDKKSCLAALDYLRERKAYDGMEEIVEQMAKNGYFSYYKVMAAYFWEEGETERAERFFRKSIDYGDRESYPLLAKLLVDTGRPDKSIEVCIEAVNKGERIAYGVLLSLLMEEKRLPEFLQYLNHAFYNGYEAVIAELEVFFSEPPIFDAVARLARLMLMEGKNLHPLLVEKFLGIEMERAPEGPFN